MCYNKIMFLTVHSFTALTTIQFLKNPFLLFILNFILHYILDAIPHGDRGKKTTHGFKNDNFNILMMAILDFIFVLIISFYFYQSYEFNIFKIILALSGAILPDLLWGFNHLIKWKIFNFFENLNSWTHQLINHRAKYLWEYSFQLIPILICYLILLTN